MKHRRRFLLPPEYRGGSSVVIEGEEARHILRVLRMKAGDPLILFDGRGKEYPGFISKVAGQKVVVALEGEAAGEGDPLLSAVLVQGIPRHDKMDFILQKATELGMSRLVPVLTRRTLLREKGDNFSARQQRWQRIVVEAAKQCRRAAVPAVENICRLEEALRQMPPHARGLLLWEEEREVFLRPLLQRWKEQREELKKEKWIAAASEGETGGLEAEAGTGSEAESERRGAPAEELWIFVGPEGGFEREEVEMARQAGVQTVSLGKRILRTETVALAVLSILMYEWGELGG